VFAGFIATMFYLPLRYRADFTQLDAARAAFIPLLIYQAIILAVLGTAAIGGGILKETDEGMIEYQRLTPLSPLAKVLGYLFGLPIRQYAAFGISAIFSAFSIIVGRIPFQAWGTVYLVLFTSTLLYHLLGLITGLIIKTRWRAGLISIGLVLLLNLVLPRLADLGFAMFSHLTVWPVVMANLTDLVPSMRGATGGWSRQLLAPDVPFWGLRMSHLAFSLMVQATLIVTFVVILVRRWRDEQAHLLGKAYAVGWLIWLQVILLGTVLPQLEGNRILTGMVRRRPGLPKEISELSGPIEARILAVTYGVIGLLILFSIISCITPREPTQMIAFRRRKKFGQRVIPWLSDGATAAPWAWIAAGATGAAWALLAERLLTSNAYGGKGFPVEGWATFIGITFVVAAIFHFLLEAYGRRAAWLTLFLAGFIPLFASLVLISISGRWSEIARYLVGFSSLSTPWQPLQGLEQIELAKLPADGPKTVDIGPFAVFCGVHIGLCLVLFFAWRSKRRSRAARA
jgi:hypothetical protein